MTTQGLRILHVLASVAPRSGGPSTVIPLARATARLGCRVTVVATDLDERGSVWPRPVRRLRQRPMPGDGVDLLLSRVRWPSRWSFSPGLLRDLVREVPRSDVVHIHSLYLFHGLAAAALAAAHGVPYVVRPHGTLDVYHWRQHRLRKRVYEWLIERHVLRHAAAIHYTSEREAYEAGLAGVTTRSLVCGLGIDLDAYADLPAAGTFRRAVPRTREKRIVAFIGRIAEKKGLDILLDAFAQLVEGRQDLHLVIAGPDDGYEGEVIRRIEALGLGAQVTRTGMLDDFQKRALLRDSEIWILPSRDENFGVAVAEALAAGVPCVISRQVAISGLVEAAGAGIVTELDSSAVASAAELILGDPARAREFSRRARALASAEFGIDQTAKRLLAAYEDLVAKRRSLQPHA